ncbi:hypothetical protein MIR68_002934 [Amoeboaphelidium protococcarum]|nr:hypothetical protein MIR68_002934 [Amoeboaphelidium protococcarum]
MLALPESIKCTLVYYIIFGAYISTVLNTDIVVNLLKRFDEFWLVSCGTFILNVALHWVLVSCYAYLDFYGSPKWLNAQKIQKVDYDMFAAYKKAIIHGLKSQFLMNLPGGFILAYLWCLSDKPVFPLPSAAQMIRDIAFYYLLEEIMFYYGHRLLHHPRIYKYIHKVHHEYKQPIGAAAVYAHPLEHLTVSLTPVVLGPLLAHYYFAGAGGHVASFWLWSIIVTFNIIHDHSGFKIPYMPDSLFHDYHHVAFTSNYGATGVLDWLHGTTKGYDQWREKVMNRKAID